MSSWHIGAHDADPYTDAETPLSPACMLSSRCQLSAFCMYSPRCQPGECRAQGSSQTQEAASRRPPCLSLRAVVICGFGELGQTVSSSEPQPCMITHSASSSALLRQVTPELLHAMNLAVQQPGFLLSQAAGALRTADGAFFVFFNAHRCMQMANMLESPLAMSLERGKVPYVAFDLHPSRLRPAREAGFNVFYGDASRPAVSPALHSMPLSLCSTLLDSALDWPVMMCSAVMARCLPCAGAGGCRNHRPSGAGRGLHRTGAQVCLRPQPATQHAASEVLCHLSLLLTPGAELASSTVPLLLYS